MTTLRLKKIPLASIIGASAMLAILVILTNFDVSQASNMGQTPHLRFALLDLGRAKEQLESIKSDGTAELEVLRKNSLESLQKAEQQVQLLRDYRANHGLRDE